MLPIQDLDSARRLIADAQSAAAQAGITLRNPPPEPTTCCGRGCNGCVWEGYYAALNYWHDDAKVLVSHDSGNKFSAVDSSPK